MKLIFASDSFKGSLSSARTAELLTTAAHEVFCECECVAVPMADGGEGTVEALTAALNGKTVTVSVHDPLMRIIGASYGISGGRAVIEMAAASGLTLVPKDRLDPLDTTTYGTGELILDALDRGCRELYIAIGGSATNDGGMGCMRALGARFLDIGGEALPGCGRALNDVSSIDLDGLDKRLSGVSITVLCDVKNPLCGENGATLTYAAQKGADQNAIDLLEKGMRNYRDVIYRRFGADCDKIEGAGAAGGLGAALRVFLKAEMRSGIETVLSLIGFDELIAGADLIVTGEGRADRQSCCGKVMQGVGMHGAAKDVPVIGLCGSVGEGAEGLRRCGVTGLIPIANSSVSTEYAMAHAEELYLKAAIGLFRRIKEDGICALTADR